jgi:hypothetical protein
MTIRVETTHASYVIDRELNRWMRISAAYPRPDDSSWISGGFTIGAVGDSCFAHFAERPDGSLGRYTSPVMSIEEYA